MGIFGSIFKKGLGAEELARRIGIPLDLLKAIRPKYREFKIRKASGGERVIHDPDPKLKEIQRLILKRVLGRLAAHPAARAFERGESIATHAKLHAGQAVVLRLDVIDFFPSIKADRVLTYFMAIGWNQEAAELLAKLCLREGRLPQGAPTSPRLSNLVNWQLDARLAGWAKTLGGRYSRYADDLIFSFAADDVEAVSKMQRMAGVVAAEEHYRLHGKKKTRVLRRHQCQRITGLVVNERPNLPRETRRRLRAIAHRIDRGEKATMTPAQLAGWRALEGMIRVQGGGE